MIRYILFRATKRRDIVHHRKANQFPSRMCQFPNEYRFIGRSRGHNVLLRVEDDRIYRPIVPGQVIKLLGTNLVPNMHRSIRTSPRDHGPVGRPRTVEQSLLGIVRRSSEGLFVTTIVILSVVGRDKGTNVPRSESSVHGITEEVRSVGMEGEAGDRVGMSLHLHTPPHLSHIPLRHTLINPPGVNLPSVRTVRHGRHLVLVLEDSHVSPDPRIP